MCSQSIAVSSSSWVAVVEKFRRFRNRLGVKKEGAGAREKGCRDIVVGFGVAVADGVGKASNIGAQGSEPGAEAALGERDEKKDESRDWVVGCGVWPCVKDEDASVEDGLEVAAIGVGGFVGGTARAV